MFAWPRLRVSNSQKRCTSPQHLKLLIRLGHDPTRTVEVTASWRLGRCALPTGIRQP